MTNSVAAIEEAHSRLEVRYQDLLGTSQSLARMLVNVRRERDQLKEEADELAGEAMDAALKQGVLTAEVKRLKVLWLTFKCYFLAHVATLAVLWWLT